MADLPELPDYQKRRFFEEMPYQLRRIVPFDESSFNEMEVIYGTADQTIYQITNGKWGIVVVGVYGCRRMLYHLMFDKQVAYKLEFMIPKKVGMEPGVIDKQVHSGVINQALAQNKIGKDLGGLLDL